jgi:arabinogalactan endo-1,4-beta-galactosidase
METLTREVNEEAFVNLNKAVPFSYLSSENNKQVMIVYYSQDYELEKFKGFEDSFERNELSVKEFLEIYFGDKKMMKKLIELGVGSIF